MSPRGKAERQRDREKEKEKEEEKEKEKESDGPFMISARERLRHETSHSCRW